MCIYNYVYIHITHMFVIVYDVWDTVCVWAFYWLLFPELFHSYIHIYIYT